MIVSTILAVVLTMVGMVFMYLMISIIQTRRKEKPTRSNHQKPGKKRIETTKKVIWVCLINGFAWVWCSYILAYLDKVQIAESLSQVAVTEIIGVVLAYSIKSAIENLSKNNKWPDKPLPGETSTTQGTPPLDL